MTDPIEGESRELVPTQPTAMRLSDTDPEKVIGTASRWATALKGVVDEQKLYALINGKRYPMVEAWMIVGAMDNTGAMEDPERPVIRQEDGSYLAHAILIRLSDGAIVGRGSAICGSHGDNPWSGRPEYNRRSMAVTRAISRAFRARYSWVMALAGYEPTPSEEMPQEGREPHPTKAAKPEATDTTAAPTVTPEAVAELHRSEGPMTLQELQKRAGGHIPPELQAIAKEKFGHALSACSAEELMTVAVEGGYA